MIDALNFIASVLGSLLAIVILAWLLFWTYRNFLQPEMETANAPQVLPEAKKITSKVGQQVARLNQHEGDAENILADVYTRLLALAAIVTDLYDLHTQCNEEARKIGRAMKCFTSDGGKTKLVDRAGFMEIAGQLQDASLTDMVSSTTAFKIPSYVDQCYLALAEAKGQYAGRATSYQRTAEQLFNEVSTIRQRFSRVQTHMKALRASRHVNAIDQQLSGISEKLMITDEDRTVRGYMMNLAGLTK